jgi:hypothetical protein
MDGSRSVGVLIRGDKKSSLEMLGLIGGPNGEAIHMTKIALSLCVLFLALGSPVQAGHNHKTRVPPSYIVDFPLILGIGY